LLEEVAVLACMVYVDLNPVRASMTRYFQKGEYTSIKKRIGHEESESGNLMPIHLHPTVSASTPQNPILSVTLAEYKALLRESHLTDGADPVPDNNWIALVLSMKHERRAYGSKDKITQWARKIGQTRIKGLHSSTWSLVAELRLQDRM